MVEHCKYLGIIIDCDLKWQNRIDYLYNKLIKFVSIFYQIRTKVPRDVLRMIYFAFVHSHLLYGIEVYANATANHLSKLIVLNNKLLRILQYKSIKSHSIDLYITYSTLPIQLVHNYQILIFIHKYVYNKDKLPSVFSNYFEENSLFHCYNTRQKDYFHTYTVLSDLGKKSVKYKGSRLWSALPSDVKDIKSLQTFKCILRKYVLHILGHNVVNTLY